MLEMVEIVKIIYQPPNPMVEIVVMVGEYHFRVGPHTPGGICGIDGNHFRVGHHNPSVNGGNHFRVGPHTPSVNGGNGENQFRVGPHTLVENCVNCEMGHHNNDKHLGVWANYGVIFTIFNTIFTIYTIYITGQDLSN